MTQIISGFNALLKDKRDKKFVTYGDINDTLDSCKNKQLSQLFDILYAFKDSNEICNNDMKRNKVIKWMLKKCDNTDKMSRGTYEKSKPEQNRTAAKSKTSQNSESSLKSQLKKKRGKSGTKSKKKKTIKKKIDEMSEIKECDKDHVSNRKKKVEMEPFWHLLKMRLIDNKHSVDLINCDNDMFDKVLDQLSRNNPTMHCTLKWIHGKSLKLKDIQQFIQQFYRMNDECIKIYNENGNNDSHESMAKAVNISALKPLIKEEIKSCENEFAKKLIEGYVDKEDNTDDYNMELLINYLLTNGFINNALCLYLLPQVINCNDGVNLYKSLLKYCATKTNINGTLLSDIEQIVSASSSNQSTQTERQLIEY